MRNSERFTSTKQWRGSLVTSNAGGWVGGWVEREKAYGYIAAYHHCNIV